jgi:ABC-type sugar transport system substrate-binding protein
VNRARTFLALLTAAAASLLLLAPGAIAADGKVVTFFAFGVMIFFVVLVITLSLWQNRLETRKERMQQELERLRRP